MLREMGIFYISIPLIGLVVSTLICLIAGADALKMSIDVGRGMRPGGAAAICEVLECEAGDILEFQREE